MFSEVVPHSSSRLAKEVVSGGSDEDEIAQGQLAEEIGDFGLEKAYSLISTLSFTRGIEPILICKNDQKTVFLVMKSFEATRNLWKDKRPIRLMS
jgi:hypothetical protein